MLREGSAEPQGERSREHREGAAAQCALGLRATKSVSPPEPLVDVGEEAVVRLIRLSTLANKVIAPGSCPPHRTSWWTPMSIRRYEGRRPAPKVSVVYCGLPEISLWAVSASCHS